MRRPLLPLLCSAILVLPGCLSRNDSASPTVAPTPVNSQAPSLPAGLPPSFDGDVTANNVPVAALVPLGAEVTGSWEASAASGEALVVTWSVPRRDPFRQDRGIALWRRFDDGGLPWRPTWATTFPAKRDPILGLSAQIADVTGDGSDDVLVLAETGGSGGCGTSFVVDLAAGTEVFHAQGCDRRVDPSSDPIGLTLTEAVFENGDPHCCPSSVRTSTLVYTDGVWEQVDSTVAPA